MKLGKISALASTVGLGLVISAGMVAPSQVSAGPPVITTQRVYVVEDYFQNPQTFRVFSLKREGLNFTVDIPLPSEGPLFLWTTLNAFDEDCDISTLREQVESAPPEVPLFLLGGMSGGPIDGSDLTCGGVEWRYPDSIIDGHGAPYIWMGTAGNYFLYVPGTYGFRADVTDNVGHVTSARFTVNVLPNAAANRPPVAQIAQPERVRPGVAVTLNGSGSYDPDGDPLTHYRWLVMWQDPATGESQAVELSDGPIPTWLVPHVPLGTTFTVALTVEDAYGHLSDPAWMEVSTTNSAPIADAGPDIVITSVYDPITFASQSYDPDGDVMFHTWEVYNPYLGSYVHLASDPIVTFPDRRFFEVAGLRYDYLTLGDIEVRYRVTDSFGVSAEDFVTISMNNLPPVAVAGDNQTVPVGYLVTLDGSGSFDPNGTPVVIFRWTITSRPEGSRADFDPIYRDGRSRRFTPDLPGMYVISLIVSDGALDSPPSTLTVSVTSNTEEAANVLSQMVQVLNGLSDASFSNPNQRKALTNKINAILQDIESGLYQDAMDKLQNDLRGKTDGCSRGRPDKNDWIADCAAQSQIFPDLLRAISMLSTL